MVTSHITANLVLLVLGSSQPGSTQPVPIYPTICTKGCQYHAGGYVFYKNDFVRQLLEGRMFGPKKSIWASTQENLSSGFGTE